MNDAFPDVSVSGYHGMIPQMPCNEKDQYVMAAAVRSSAATINYLWHYYGLLHQAIIDAIYAHL